MRFFKKSVNSHNLLKSIFLFITFFYMNNINIIFSSENKICSLNKKQNYCNFEQVFFQDFTNFSNYDFFEGQLKSFFGYSSSEPGKSFYPDLLIINSSDNIRNLYNIKLNDMTTID